MVHRSTLVYSDGDCAHHINRGSSMHDVPNVVQPGRSIDNDCGRLAERLAANGRSSGKPASVGKPRVCSRTTKEKAQ